MIFDIICYATTIIAVIAFVGSNKSAPRQIVEDLNTLHAIAESLPSTDECFAVDVPATVPAPVPVTPAQFDCGDRATVEEWAIVETAQEAIALRWACDNVVPFVRPVKAVAVKAVSYRNRDELRAHCWAVLGTAYDSIGGKRKFWTVARMTEELNLAGWEVSKAA